MSDDGYQTSHGQRTLDALRKVLASDARGTPRWQEALAEYTERIKASAQTEQLVAAESKPGCLTVLSPTQQTRYEEARSNLVLAVLEHNRYQSIYRIWRQYADDFPGSTFWRAWDEVEATGLILRRQGWGKSASVPLVRLRPGITAADLLERLR